MKATEFIRTMLSMPVDQSLALIDDMKDLPLNFPTANGGNHPLWVLGHLTVIEARIIYEFMRGDTSPFAHWYAIFGRGSIPVADAAAYPPYEEVRRAFDQVRAETLAVLRTLNDADLDRACRACPPGFEPFVGTVGLCFSRLGTHFTYHVGQVADARRMAGRGPLGW